MATAEATESRPAITLAAVLVAVKAITLTAHSVAWSVWTPFVYVWQDLLVAAIWGLSIHLIRRPWFTWVSYALIVAYAALNVPVTWELSSPMSQSMWHAARGPLADSIGHALTMKNVVAIAGVLALAVVVPRFTRRLRTTRALVLVAAAWILIGAFATSKIDTGGWHRNALAALLPAAVPVAAAGPSPSDWRRSPFGESRRDDLSTLRAAAKGANVVLVALESTAAQYLRMYGAPRDPTPNLTRLAERAVVFDRAYSVYPESIKGLFATLCSRAPGYNTTAESYASVSCRSFPDILKNHGYRTGLFHSGRFDYLGMRSIIEHRGFDVLEDAGAIGGNVNSSFGVGEDATVDRMLGWIDGLKPSDRFFMTYLPIAGHHPYATTKPPMFADGTERGQYLDALHEGDEALGRLLEGLRARGRDRDTLIVLFGDHGEAFRQHEGNSGHTLFIYEENVHVPLLVALPGWGDDARLSGRHVTRVASLIDLAPTMIDLLGLPAEAEHEGASLLAPADRLALYFTDYALGWLGLADGCFTYLFQVESQRSSLYDVCRDPAQTHDVASANQQRVAAYRDRLERWAAR